MTFSFKYKPIKLKTGEIIYRPLIPITFEGKERIDILAILDSGSDISIISEEIAEPLGIIYEKDNVVFGLSREPINAKEGKINVKFGKGKECYNFLIPVLIPIGNSNIPIIIGRAGFFSQFKISFLESIKKVEFKKFEIHKY